jgi:hypothetical protein
MKQRHFLALVRPCWQLLSLALCALAAGQTTRENAVERDGRFSLAPGPNVEGVVLVHQGDWPDNVIRAFHETPWLDAASIRLKWSELEPRDQQFNWAPFDKVLAEVKRYNAAHAGARRTLHIRVMGGEHVPRWFEQAGVRFYDTTHRVAQKRDAPLQIPVPYDNAEFLKQLREVYRAMVERYRDEPLVTVYHGTWSAGPWDEIFHPQGDAPMPPDYTPEKFVRGMVEQLDVLIEEFCLRGKVAELPFSGKYPTKQQINITGPIVARIVERLGRRSPLLYIQSNGWGMTNTGRQTVSWGHERDIDDARGQVNLALQALGTNIGRGWMPQGDWVGLIEIAKRYDAAYLEIYPPDLMPLNTKHRIVQAFTQTTGQAASGAPNAVEGLVGFQPWLKQRARVLYVRDGIVRKSFATNGPPRRLQGLAVKTEAPPGTTVSVRARTRADRGAWSDWRDAARAAGLAAGTEVEIEARLHTDDGCVTPAVVELRPIW